MFPLRPGIALLTLVALARPILAQPAPPSAAPEPAPPAGAPPSTGATGDPALDGHAAAGSESRRTAILETDVAGPWLGVWSVGLVRGLGSHFALRGEGARIHTLDGHQRGYQGGVSLAFYFRHTFSGPFVEIGEGLRNVEKDCSSCGSGSMETYPSNLDMNLSAMAGWHWMFGSGVSVAAAVGAVERIDLAQGMPSVEPGGYVQLGYAF